MAALSECPSDRVRHQAFERAQLTLSALREMRYGGTSTDVRDRVADKLGHAVSLSAIKSALWHLHDVGLCEQSADKNVRRWKVTRSTE